MELSSLIGIIAGFGAILLGYVIEGGSILKILTQPSPFIIIFGGTFGALALSFPTKDLAKLPSALSGIFKKHDHNEIEIINLLASLSEKARKNGLLSLEQDAQSNDNELIKKGLSLVVDGIEASVIRDILVREGELKERLSESSAKIFEAAGGFAPTMGVCGTVLGMVTILANMSDASELGPKISVAFIATLLGISFANLVFIPVGNKIKINAEKEAAINDIIIEGLLSIQAGENPRIIREKLNLSLLEKLNGVAPKNSGENAEEKTEEGK